MVRTPSPGVLRVGSTGGKGASRDEPATGRGTKAAVRGARADSLSGPPCSPVAWPQQVPGNSYCSISKCPHLSHSFVQPRHHRLKTSAFFYSTEARIWKPDMPIHPCTNSLSLSLGSVCCFAWWDLWPLRDLRLDKHWFISCGK